MTTRLCLALLLALLAACGRDPAAALLAAGDAPASDLERAPPSFAVGEAQAVFVDIERAAYALRFDVAAKAATGEATLTFTQPVAGFPVLDLRPRPTKVTVDGADVDVALYAERSGAPLRTPMRVLQSALAAGRHTVTIAYELTAPTVRFDPAGASFLTVMSDVKDAGFNALNGYLENYAPANLEYDHYPSTLTVEVLGATRPHRLMTNGALAETGEGRWTIEFPDYFTASSPYVHLLDPARFHVAQGAYAGMERSIPVTAYARTRAAAEDGLTQIKAALHEFEGAIGPYTHASYTAYVETIGGGMEFCGATYSDPDALRHEIFHSWFARGVMPNGGNDGWIDEAVTTWAEYGYSNRLTGTPRAPSKLQHPSPYNRFTPLKAYVEGEEMMRLVSRALDKDGGLKAVLRRLYAAGKRASLTTERFQEILTAAGPSEPQAAGWIDAYFARWVRGEDRAVEVPPVAADTPPPSGSPSTTGAGAHDAPSPAALESLP